MILPNKNEALHKTMLYRLLINILDSPPLAQQLYFKGGTAAAMLGWLDRFSLDLDFDLKPQANKLAIERLLEKLLKHLNFIVKEKAPNELFYVLKYTAPSNKQHLLKLSIVSALTKANRYQPYLLSEINRYCLCQTPETMFANKLVALTDRYQKHQVIAGRDLYDIHHFLLSGFSYSHEVIKERTDQEATKYLQKLRSFIRENITQQVIDEDLNYLLPAAKFKAIRKTLVAETLSILV